QQRGGAAAEEQSEAERLRLIARPAAERFGRELVTALEQEAAVVRERQRAELVRRRKQQNVDEHRERRARARRREASRGGGGGGAEPPARANQQHAPEDPHGQEEQKDPHPPLKTVIPACFRLVHRSRRLLVFPPLVPSITEGRGLRSWFDKLT